jgi:antitoxin CptB
VTTLDTALAPHQLNRLRWRCRRGLLENDLLIERFFARHGAALTPEEAQGLEELMALPDNDLLDLLLGRIGPAAVVESSRARGVLSLMKARPLHEQDNASHRASKEAS